MVRLVKTSLSSLVLFSKCLGIFPYHISTNNGVTFSVTFAIWSILLNILLSYGSFLAILTPAEFEINAIYDGLMNVQFVSLQFALNLHVICYDSSYDIITSILYHIQAAFLFSATYQVRINLKLILKLRILISTN
ncbi:hypothetical protein O3M35_012589 [Rhynocoris fuscipes]|uniref:Uncharacterized protein n=1 Tax=Rhynocoris fuscipes TaxID=488301 RepID=A0AAW1CWR8_9HEMI